MHLLGAAAAVFGIAIFGNHCLFLAHTVLPHPRTLIVPTKPWVLYQIRRHNLIMVASGATVSALLCVSIRQVRHNPVAGTLQ